MSVSAVVPEKSRGNKNWRRRRKSTTHFWPFWHRCKMDVTWLYANSFGIYMVSASEMTYIVSSGALNSTPTNHCLYQANVIIFWLHILFYAADWAEYMQLHDKSPQLFHTCLIPRCWYYPVVKVDRRIRWHYTTTILRLRIGARLTRYRNCKFHYFARTISRHADSISRYRLVPMHFYPWYYHWLKLHWSLNNSILDACIIHRLVYTQKVIIQSCLLLRCTRARRRPSTELKQQREHN